ncbi:DUF3574 domain-containing protein [Caloranaerobacter ferrireducens]|uniref:DUF3574 domain-containing protein n=1 Tax=Caloranaerobacter ferrireducens TaxID=1323370 RepID=UPI00084D64A0|nr:DUF3574 domain-containing protein [Caloranaerobacter ferrireducens]
MQFKFKLAHKIILYVPLKYGDGKNIPDEITDSILKKSIDKLTNISTGFTVIEGRGFWKTKENKMNDMKTKIIIIYVNELEEATKVIYDLALWIKKETISESICFEIDNSLYFV